MSCIIESVFERIDGVGINWCSGVYVVMLVFGEKRVRCGWFDHIHSGKYFVYKAIDANVFSSMQTFWLNWSHAES